MTKRNLTWLRQHTNVEDLLDDGIENNSDLKSLAKSEEAGESTLPGPSTSGGTQPYSQPPNAKVERTSIFGMVVGIVMSIAGSLFVLFPVDMLVYHQQSGYRAFWEHVTHVRSEIYGTSSLLLGVALFLYAIYKPRK